MDKDLLNKLQNAEFKILCDIDDYCRINNIKYSLYAGTMLGAVRHGGFIPWDDDIDICMTRSEYTRFCQIVKEHPLDGYFFQNFEIDKACMMNHGKLRKNGTILLSEGEREDIGHHGIWIDIFPLDKYSGNKLQAFKTVFYGKLIILFTRANQIISAQDNNKRFVNKLIRIIPDVIRQKILLFAARKLRQYDKSITRDYEWISMSALYSFKFKYPDSIIREYGILNFNGRDFNAFKKYDNILSIIYGDYMKLPPESERVCRHNPIKVKL